MPVQTQPTASRMPARQRLLRSLLAGFGLVAAGCFYDFNNPVKDVVVGEIRGVAMREEPGTGKLVPAVGAQVLIKGTNIAVKTDPKGRFRILGMPPTGADDAYTLVLRYSTTGTKVYDLVTIKKGVVLLDGDGVNLREIVVEKTGTITGFVKLQDLAETTDLHGGSFVGIPGTNQATTTFKDGFFAIELLAGGIYDLAAWRPGYQMQRVEQEVPPGKTVQTAETKLPTVTEASTTTLSGVIGLGAPLGGDDELTVHVVEAGVSAPLGKTGQTQVSFSVEVPEGVYTIRASAPGFREVYLTNVVAEGSKPTNAVGRLTLFFTGAGEDCDKDGSPNDVDEDDDNDDIPDADEPGCECYPELGRAYACFQEPLCRPILQGTSRNAVPVSNPGCNVLQATIGQPVVLDGSKSFDLDGSKLTYSWRITQVGGQPPVLGDVANESSPTLPIYRFTPQRDNKDYKVELTVNDGSGFSLPAVSVVHVEGVNVAPTFPGLQSGQVWRTLGKASDAVLQAPSANDPDGSPVAGFAWIPYDDYYPPFFSGDRPPLVPLPLLGEPTAGTANPKLARVPPVGTYKFVVFSIDKKGLYSEPVDVEASFVEDPAASIFVNGDPSCTGRGSGSAADPYCSLQDALTESDQNGKDLYLAGSFDPNAYQLPGPIRCKEGRSIYGGWVTQLNAQSKREWFRDPEGNQTTIGAMSGSETIRCEGPISPQTVIDGLHITPPSNWTPPPCGNVHRAVVMSNHASPTFSNNHVEPNTFAGRPAGQYATVHIRLYSSPVLLNNIILGDTASEGVIGVRIQDGSLPLLAHNVIDIRSFEGGMTSGSIGVIGDNQPACGNPEPRCLNTSGQPCTGGQCFCKPSTTCDPAKGPCSGVDIPCAVDQQCSEPSTPLLYNNVIRVEGGAGRWGYVEVGLRPVAFEGNILKVDAGTEYVHQNGDPLPPFNRGPSEQMITTQSELDGLFPGVGNLIADPLLGEPCLYCPFANSPAVDTARPVPAVPGTEGLFLDHQGARRPDGSGKADIGANERYDRGE